MPFPQHISHPDFNLSPGLNQSCFVLFQMPPPDCGRVHSTGIAPRSRCCSSGRPSGLWVSGVTCWRRPSVPAGWSGDKPAAAQERWTSGGTWTRGGAPCSGSAITEPIFRESNSESTAKGPQHTEYTYSHIPMPMLSICKGECILDGLAWIPARTSLTLTLSQV